MSGATIIVGAQWGDEGKGLISAYISARDEAKYVIRCGTGPNAEHGIFLKNEITYLKTNQLPLGWIFNKNIQIGIGSGVALDPVKFFAEIEKYGLEGRVMADYRCPIVEREHIEAERNNQLMKNIGSTMSGTGLCRASFILRKARQAKNVSRLNKYIGDISVLINNACYSGENVVLEGSQGTLLSLAVSSDYPNVTSDNVTSMAIADDALLNWHYIKDVILVVKTVPTREGAGAMGKVAEMSKEEMAKKGFVEISSIDNQIRRKAYGIDWDMLRYACEINGATQIALTFLDHYDPGNKNIKEKTNLKRETRMFIKEVSKKAGVPVTILNTGKAYDNIIDLEYDNPVDWEDIAHNLPLTKQ